MTSLDQLKPINASLFLSRCDPPLILAFAALLIGTPLHFLNLGLPLWIDESGTGGTVSQDSVANVLRLCLFDVNAPLYFVFEHFWTMLFGLSNVAMRVPSAIFAAAGAWYVMASRDSVERDVRLLWAALLALWVPGLFVGEDARCYGLLLLFATIDTVLFIRLARDLDRRSAFAWASVSVLLILTHYHALLLVGAQGLGLLAWHRGRVLALWPALFVFVPVPIWLALHIHNILSYLAPQTAWYWLLQPRDLFSIVDFLTNSTRVAFVAVLMGLSLLLRRQVKTGTVKLQWDPLWLAVLTALIPALFVIAMGFVRPSFAPRYLIPFGPGVLLGLVLIAQRLAPTWRFAPLAMLIVFAAPTVEWITKQADYEGNPYSFEKAADYLIGSGSHRLVFYWDNPNSAVLPTPLYVAFGGFFFKRAGVPVDVTPIRPQPGADPNSQLVDTAKAQKAAILWIFDRAVAGTQARAHPSVLAKRDGTAGCHDFGNSRYGIIACPERTALR
ncbi:MAG: hypothetical protein ACLP8A_18020 [Methylovirgula sp.]